MQRVCRPWARMWLAERAVMAALPRCMVWTLHPPKALNLAKRHTRLQRKPLPNTMAKFTPMELMSEVHGKLHGKSKYYAAEKYGTQYTGLIGEITVPPTENQLTARDKFKQARQNVGALSEEEIAAYQEAFSKYRGKYKTLQGYMLAKEYAKLV